MNTIMIVDDESEILNKVKTYLEKENYNVITAENSRKALELMTDQEDFFSLLLIDTQMPGSKKSALFSMKAPHTNDTSNFENFLEKPFTQEQLINFVKKSINKK